MAEESLIEGEDENILYDLLVLTEWPPETDTQVSFVVAFCLVFGSYAEHLFVKMLPESHLSSLAWGPPLKAT